MKVRVIGDKTALDDDIRKESMSLRKRQRIMMD